MATNEIPHPPIVSREEWLVARKTLLGHEKEQTRQYDRVNAERRRLPMVTTFAVVSRAPLEKLDAYKDQKKWRIDDDVFHTYSAYARGTESLTDAYRLLDMTPYGRQQEFEDSPAGWPQHPTYG